MKLFFEIEKFVCTSNAVRTIYRYMLLLIGVIEALLGMQYYVHTATCLTKTVALRLEMKHWERLICKRNIGTIDTLLEALKKRLASRLMPDLERPHEDLFDPPPSTGVHAGKPGATATGEGSAAPAVPEVPLLKYVTMRAFMLSQQRASDSLLAIRAQAIAAASNHAAVRHNLDENNVFDTGRILSIATYLNT